MYRKYVITSLVALSLLLSGCGDESDTTCRIDVQNALDDGEFDKAIALMEGSCAAAYEESDLNLNLATAYMGKSGFGVSDVVAMIIDANDNSSDALTSFTVAVDENKEPNSLPMLDRSNSYYLASIAEGNLTTAEDLCSVEALDATDDSRRINVCLYIGFNETIKAVNTITYLTDDLTTLVDSINSDSNATPLDMQASLDALAWSLGQSIPNGSDINATDVNISGVSYAHLAVSNPSDSGLLFYRLAKSSTPGAINSTVITDGYCDINGNKENCLNMEDNETGAIINPISGCYACPVAFDSTDGGSISALLVDALNNGVDTVVAVTDDPDITETINDFKADLGVAADADITITDILDYLNQ